MNMSCHFVFRSICWLALVNCALLTQLSDLSFGRDNPIVKAAATTRPSVVNIRGEKEIYSSDDNSSETVRRVKGMGAGVIIDSRGYIVTNYHVIDSIKEILVTTADGKSYPARCIAREQATDLAIIKIDAPVPLQTIAVGDSDDLEIGETVIAMGNAYGYEHTVTMGIVSALHRTVQASDVQTYVNLIQTDASINPGNSGGPLLNIDGEMIGINAAVRAGAQGIGFAIPVNAALERVADMLQKQSSQLARHGLTVATVSLPDGRKAVEVENVEKNSPADKIGIRQGDYIHAIEGAVIQNRVDFVCALVESVGGSSVDLEIIRDNEPYKFSLELQKPAGMTNDALTIWNVLGLELANISADEFKQKYTSQYRGGLRVTRVREGSPAYEQGIEPGDALIGLHKWETLSIDNVMYILTKNDLSTISPLKFLIIRNQNVLYGTMTLPNSNIKVVSY